MSLSLAPLHPGWIWNTESQGVKTHHYARRLHSKLSFSRSFHFQERVETLSVNSLHGVGYEDANYNTLPKPNTQRCLQQPSAKKPRYPARMPRRKQESKKSSTRDMLLML